MSKQQIAKERQNYIAKPVFPMCSNCMYFLSEKIHTNPKWPEAFTEKTTCQLGTFAVKKQATCNYHEPQI